MRHPIVLSVAVGVAAGAVVALLAARFATHDPWSHSVGHLILWLPAAILLYAALRLWPPAPAVRVAELARKTLIVGLIVLAAGGVSESIGAFGYTGNERNALALVHDVGVLLSPLGILGTMLGVGLSIAVALGSRFGFLESRWMGMAVLVIVGGAAVFIVVGLIVGY